VTSAFLTSVLLVLAATDLERMVIPNRVVLPAALVVLIGRVAADSGHTLAYVLAGVGAGLVFLIPNLISRSLLGLGDVKLALLLGIGLGFSVVGAVAIAFLAVFPVALGIVIRGGLAARKTAIPFGPFLAFGGILMLVFPGLLGLSVS
jgi:leader peptidase (prepilin peptidase)/N-methyltransferase